MPQRSLCGFTLLILGRHSAITQGDRQPGLGLQLPPTTNQFTPPHSQVPWLSTSRTSRTVFLSDERGTGKTTVLASLLVRATQPKSSESREGADGLVTVPTPLPDRGKHFRQRWIPGKDMPRVRREQHRPGLPLPTVREVLPPPRPWFQDLEVAWKVK